MVDPLAAFKLLQFMSTSQKAVRHFSSAFIEGINTVWLMPLHNFSRSVE